MRRLLTRWDTDFSYDFFFSAADLMKTGRRQELHRLFEQARLHDRAGHPAAVRRARRCARRCDCRVSHLILSFATCADIREQHAKRLRHHASPDGHLRARHSAPCEWFFYSASNRVTLTSISPARRLRTSELRPMRDRCCAQMSFGIYCSLLRNYKLTYLLSCLSNCQRRQQFVLIMPDGAVREKRRIVLG